MDLERVKEGGLERHETALHVAARLGKLGMARALAERCSRYQVWTLKQLTQLQLCSLTQAFFCFKKLKASRKKLKAHFGQKKLNLLEVVSNFNRKTSRYSTKLLF